MRPTLLNCELLATLWGRVPISTLACKMQNSVTLCCHHSMARLELSRTGKNMKIKQIEARVGKMARQVKEFNTKLDDTRTNLMEGEK